MHTSALASGFQAGDVLGRIALGGRLEVEEKPARRRQEPDDLVTLREAAEAVGKTVDTLKRWRGVKGLKVYKHPSEPNAPLRVSQAQVMHIARKISESTWGQAHLAPTSQGDAKSARSLRGNGAVSASAVRMLEDSVSYERERAANMQGRLEREIDGLKAELKEARGQIAEKQERIAALERELHGGVARGLLGRVFRWAPRQ